MSYITNTSIQNRLGLATYVQLADDDGDGQADAVVVDEVRLAAEGEVNSYLARRFSVPIDLATHPDLSGLLASITLDLAEYRLRLRRPPVPASAAKRYEQAVQWLQGVADGVIDLPGAGVTPNPDRSSLGSTASDPRVLTHEELSDF